MTEKSGKNPWLVEVRSLNHRYFDFSLRVPSDFVEFETRIRDLVRSRVSRGKISLSATRSAEEGEGRLDLDEEVVQQYLKGARRLKRQYGLQGDVTVEALLKLPRIFTSRRVKQESAEVRWKALQPVLLKALDQTIRSKQLEGKKIAKDMRMRLGLIANAVKKIEKMAKDRSQKYFLQLKARVEELIGRKEFEEERLMREVAILAEKSDVTEEIVRLKSHLSLFDTRLRSNEEVGRELDFLCQEMNREINTIGSKAQLFEIAREVVFVKGEIEKIREQVQNVE